MKKRRRGAQVVSAMPAKAGRRFVSAFIATAVAQETPEAASAQSRAVLENDLESVRYSVAGGPNQVASASASPSWVESPTQATYPSGRINTAVGAVTAPRTGTSHVPAYLASICWTRSAHGVMSRSAGSPKLSNA